MADQFVSERLEPVGVTFDAARMATGEPGLPREFIWRGETIRIARVLRTWRDTGPCRNGSREAYVRKHGCEVETDSGQRMRIYFDRSPHPGRRAEGRWWLLSVSACDATT